MCSRALSSYVLLRMCTDASGDYIDTFMPFVATVLASIAKGKSFGCQVEVSEIQHTLQKEFGLGVPQMAMSELIRRAEDRNLLKWHSYRYYVNESAVAKMDLSTRTMDYERRQSKFVAAFIEYAEKATNDHPWTQERAQDAVSAVLREFNLDILRATRSDTIDVSLSPTIDKHDRYLMWSFVRHVHENDDDLFGIIRDMAMGSVLANALHYREISGGQSASSDLDLTVYLDTPTILRMLGAEGPDDQEACQEYLDLLREKGVRCCIFNHTRREIDTALADALRWIDSESYDPARANNVARYFVETARRRSELVELMSSVSDFLQKNEIEVCDLHGEDQDDSSNPSWDELYQAVVDRYKRASPGFDEEAKRRTIENDVETICALYRLRRGSRPFCINDLRHVFTTPNSALAGAVSVYESEASAGSPSAIPVCVTVDFMATALWLAQPARLLSYNEKRLLAACQAALEPSTEILTRYVNILDSLHGKGEITSREVYLFRTNGYVMRTLSAKVMGDPDRVTPGMAREVMEAIRSDVWKEAQRHYDPIVADEREARTKVENRLDQLSRRSDDLQQSLGDKERCLKHHEEHIRRVCHKIGKASERVVVVAMFGAAALIYLAAKADEQVLRIVRCAGSALFTLLGIFACADVYAWKRVIVRLGGWVESVALGYLLPDAVIDIQKSGNQAAAHGDETDGV